MAALKFGGVDMPDPALNGLTYKPEKIWSKNTGRGADARMLGDVIAIKMTLQIKWNILSDAQVVKIDAAITPAFFPVYFKNPRTGKYETKTFYADAPTYPVYSYVSGLPAYNGVAVDLIEQ